MKKQKILQVNFSHLKSYENVAQIPDKIYLLDNFDEKKDKISYEILDFPVQLQMPMTIICTAGEGEISINLQHYNIHAGQIASVAPNSLFQFIKASTGFECACIMVNKNVMPVNFNVKLGIEAAMSLKDLPVFTPSLKDFSIIIDAYKNAKSIIMREDFLFIEDMTKCYLDIIRCTAMNAILKSKEQLPTVRPTSRKEEIFMKFIATLQQYYTHERNVKFYADKLCMTPKYLSTVVHEMSGKYATQWINDYVILECKAMLKAEGDSVKNVCNRLNFTNQSFFAKYFKKHTGMTPLQYKTCNR